MITCQLVLLSTGLLKLSILSRHSASNEVSRRGWCLTPSSRGVWPAAVFSQLVILAFDIPEDGML